MCPGWGTSSRRLARPMCPSWGTSFSVEGIPGTGRLGSLPQQKIIHFCHQLPMPSITKRYLSGAHNRADHYWSASTARLQDYARGEVPWLSGRHVPSLLSLQTDPRLENENKFSLVLLCHVDLLSPPSNVHHRDLPSCRRLHHPHHHPIASRRRITAALRQSGGLAGRGGRRKPNPDIGGHATSNLQTFCHGIKYSKKINSVWSTPARTPAARPAAPAAASLQQPAASAQTQASRPRQCSPPASPKERIHPGAADTAWVVGWLPGWLAGWLVEWLVGWLGGWLVGWLFGDWVGGLMGGKIVGGKGGGQGPMHDPAWRPCQCSPTFPTPALPLFCPLAKP
eukprot:365203-Chlamydomonas_euryale.AAC.10